MKITFLCLLGIFLIITIGFGQDLSMNQDPETVEEVNMEAPVKVAVIGLVHTHVHWILGRESAGDIEIVAIVESNRELAERYAVHHGYSMDIVFPSIDDMLKKVKPEAVAAFNRIYDHLEVVEKFAPLGIHVMVEKPLAVSLEHAIKMRDLAQKHQILLLTNYETSWYPSNHYAHDLVDAKNGIGDIRKLVFHDGHQGPIEIGCNPEFTDWLCDPKWNGGGALMDFGCYGANLATWIMNGARPISVTAVTKQIKPELYPNVEDEATIILTYPESQAIIQASWNWPYSRKDMEVYGTEGAVFALDKDHVSIRGNDNQKPNNKTLGPLSAPYNDPFTLYAALIKRQVLLSPFDPSSLENNMIVMEILDAAKRSAASATTITLNEK